MEKYFEILGKSQIFCEIKKEDLPKVFEKIGGTVKNFKKGEFVFRAGEEISQLCILLEGSLHILREDYWGNANIITDILPGEVFAEVYSCLENTKIEVSVAAIKDSRVFMADINKIIYSKENISGYDEIITKNFISVIARKNLRLNSKVSHISGRSIREKLISYLSYVSEKKGSGEFEIPFNRQQLADYLNTDRSALSAELGKMRKEGIIEFEKNKFKLK